METENLIKMIHKRHNQIYTHQLGIQNGQYKGFIIDDKSKRYIIAVRNKTIAEIYSTKLQKLALKTKTLTLQKLNMHIGNAFTENLTDASYVFEIVLSIKDTTFVDILYHNSEYLESSKYRDRLISLNELFPTRNSQMKVLDTEPTLSIDAGCDVNMIIRNLLEFPNYSNDHTLKSQRSVNFLVLGQGIIKRVLNFSLKKDKYISVSEILPNTKRFLFNALGIQDPPKTELVEEKYQLEIFNDLKSKYFQQNKIDVTDVDSEMIPLTVDQSYRVYLVGGRNTNYGITIFGVTKSGCKLFKDNLDTVKTMPNLINWESEEYKKQFKSQSIGYYENAFTVIAKQIQRSTSKKLSIINVTKTINRVDFRENETQIKGKIEEIAFVPPIETNKKSTETFNTASDNDVFGETIKRLNAMSTTATVPLKLHLKTIILYLFEQMSDKCKDISIIAITAAKYIEKNKNDQNKLIDVENEITLGDEDEHGVEISNTQEKRSSEDVQTPSKKRKIYDTDSDSDSESSSEERDESDISD